MDQENIPREVKNYFVLNRNKNKTSQHTLTAGQTVLREKLYFKWLCRKKGKAYII